MFIAIEGIDGSGKTTVCQLVQSKLQEKGEDCLLTKPLGADQASLIIRSLLLDPEKKLDLDAAPFMFMADMIHVSRAAIIPAMSNGQHVICDRYMASTFTYQIDTADHLQDQQKNLLIGAMQLWLPEPDLTVVLDVGVETAFQRVKARDEEKGIEFAAKDIYESADHLDWERRRIAYLSYHESGLARDSSVLVIHTDGKEALTPDEIADHIVNYHVLKPEMKPVVMENNLTV